METLKIYFVCRYDGPQWWYCFGLLSNGFKFGEHLCSDPGFAPQDLYFRCKPRIEALRQVFGVNPQTIEWELLSIKTKEDVPEWWEKLANTQSVQDELAPFYDKYCALLKELEETVKS